MNLQDIKSFLESWGQSIVEIGKQNNQPEIQKEATQTFITRFYGYDDFPVLFKPTKATKNQFRNNPEGALSYFIGENSNFPEDFGFALKPWEKVRFEFADINIIDKIGIAMGNYYFSNSNNEKIKAEFSFVVKKNSQQKLKIILHHSSSPCLK